METEETNEQLHIYADQTKEVVVRHGDAFTFQTPEVLTITGTLRAPFQYLQRKLGGLQQPTNGIGFNFQMDENSTLYNPRRATLLANRKAGTLRLLLNDKDPVKDEVTGTLRLADEAKDFRINEGSLFNLQEVIKIVKRNKFKFADPADQANFLMQLQNFNAKVTTTIKHVRDQGGSSMDMIQKTVEENKNAPRFTLNIPIYEGYDKKLVGVQTCLEAKDSSIHFYFESEDLFTLMDSEREAAFAAELALFNEKFPCSIVDVM